MLWVQAGVNFGAKSLIKIFGGVEKVIKYKLHLLLLLSNTKFEKFYLSDFTMCVLNEF